MHVLFLSLKLTSIIWGEAGENGEHIVPYQAGKEDDRPNKIQNEDITTLKPSEQKLLGAKLDLHGMKLECFNRSNKNGGIAVSRLDSWPNLSSSEAAKDEQGSVGTGVTDNVTEINECNLSKAETAQHDADADIFGNTQDKEHTDFSDYGWENISSFDDLDRIFSNDEPIFGQANLDKADEIWSSSKDATSGPVRSFSISADSPGLISGALTSSSEIPQVKTEYEHQDEQSFNLGYDKMNEPASISFQQRNATVEPVVNDQVYRHKTLHKSQKKSREKAEGKIAQDIYGSWSSHVDLGGQCGHQPSPFPSSINQLSGIRGPEPTHFQQISDPYAQSSAFRNYAESFPAILSPTSFQSREVKCPVVFPGYKASSTYVDSTGKRLDSPGKPPTMTPQEKIEKLRRRQQMQAMLAIKKQLQQFVDEICPSDAQGLTLEISNQHSKGAHLEVDDLSSLPSIDVSSSIEQDGSTFVSAAVDGSSIEDVVLNQLQDVIAKLDDRIKICIRDSLYRLAKSTVKRQHTGSMIGTVVHPQDEHEVLAKEESEASNREVKPADVETDTNPIDRAVAHLLFHRPFSTKLPGTPESLISQKLPHKHKAQELANVQNEGLSKILKTESQSSLQGSESTDQMTDTHQINQFKNSTSMDTSENAYVPTEGGAGALEALQEQ
ncbi:protein LNK2 isoform X5 [Eucalyptus grandis]|uniref:protein LNK2 isoform X5 n=1 Tax=Eucalyptus grandis TaxID=71139 RepID=UPI00192EC5F4|nr:protein LNK2 isoform X5 [Eucalyptus grandis]